MYDMSLRQIVKHISSAPRTCQHHVEHDAAGPYVSLFAVILIVQEDFGCNVVRGPANRFWS